MFGQSLSYQGERLFDYGYRIYNEQRIKLWHLQHPGCFWTMCDGDLGLKKSIGIINASYAEEWINRTPFWHSRHYNYNFIHANMDVK